MKQKLIKLTKRLNTFTKDDLALMVEIDEKTVEKYLAELVDENIIRDTGNNSYLFIGQKIKGPKVSACKNNKDCSNPRFFNNSEFEAIDNELNTLVDYTYAPETTKNKVDKFIKVIKYTNGLIGSPLQRKIALWNEENQKDSVSISSVYNARRILKKYGLKGLIHADRFQNIRSTIVTDNFYADFKEFLFENKEKKLKQCYSIYKSIFFEENSGCDEWEFPSYSAICYRIQKDFMDSNNNDLAFFYDEITGALKKKRLKSKTIDSAIKDYLNFLQEENRVAVSTFIGYKGYANNHLIPFFKNLTFKDLSEELLEEFKQTRLKENCSERTLNKIIVFFNAVIKNYSDVDFTASKLSGNYSKKGVTGFNYLTNKQIKKLLNYLERSDSDLYALILTAILSGLSRSELFALTWDKIKWNNKTILVDCCYNKTKAVIYKSKAMIREVNVPDRLLNVLKHLEVSTIKNEKNLVFPNTVGNYMNSENLVKRKFLEIKKDTGIHIRFRDLRHTYAALQIQHNQPITYIQHQLGHYKIQVTYNMYKDLLVEKVNKIDVLANILD